MLNKKGQEEVVGFSLVVIIVAVVGLLIFGIVIRSGGKANNLDNYEIKQFLDSSMHVSTECTLRSNIDYAIVNDLVRECYKNPAKECFSSGNKVCDELNSSLNGIIKKGMQIGLDRPNKGFFMNISFESKEGKNEKILELNAGKCEGDYSAGEYLIPEDKNKGIIVARLTVCK